jgi:1,6-anhydro-N-acetylmuramate kinase
MAHSFSDLLERDAKPSRTVVGLMSGTSADAIDVAVCRMKRQGPEVELLHFSEHAHDPEVKRQVRATADLDVRGIAELNVRVGEARPPSAFPATVPACWAGRSIWRLSRLSARRSSPDRHG